MLKISDLTKTYQKNGQELLVMSLPSLEIEAGEQVVLLGPSGSGKSTLLHLIAGIVRPTTGSVHLLDTDILQLSESQMDTFRAKHIGYVFQNFNLLAGFTALENVKLAMQFANIIPSRERAQRAKSLLQQVGLEQRLDHKPTQLSNGEQQRVAIARALANNPSLVLADEPTASLDFDNAQEVISLLQKMCKQNQATLLLCTHDLDLVPYFKRSLHLIPPSKKQGKETSAHVYA